MEKKSNPLLSAVSLRESEEDMNNMIKTIEFGQVPIRRTHKIGERMANIELSDDGYAEIRKDCTTQQPFAVLFDENWNEL